MNDAGWHLGIFSKDLTSSLVLSDGISLRYHWMARPWVHPVEMSHCKTVWNIGHLFFCPIWRHDMVFWALKKITFLILFSRSEIICVSRCRKQWSWSYGIVWVRSSTKNIGSSLQNQFTDLYPNPTGWHWDVYSCFGQHLVSPEFSPFWVLYPKHSSKHWNLEPFFETNPSWWSEPKEPLWKTLEMKLGNIPQGTWYCWWKKSCTTWDG